MRRHLLTITACVVNDLHFDNPSQFRLCLALRHWPRPCLFAALDLAMNEFEGILLIKKMSLILNVAFK